MKTFHNFLKLFVLIILLFCISCSSKPTKPEIFQGRDNEWTTSDITQNRDISQYEQGGHFWCRMRPYGNEENPLNGEEKVRNFIWQHWTEKKRGYIKISCGGVDTSSTTHYFIEPNEKGEWIIATRNLFKHALPEYDNQPIKDDVAVSVEKVESDKNKSDWTLILKANDGEILDKLPMF